MQCPDCGYMMLPFDKECSRCKAFQEKGLAKPLSRQEHPAEPPPSLAVPAAHLAQHTPHAPSFYQCVRCGAWLVPGALSCSQCALSFTAPVPATGSAATDQLAILRVADAERHQRERVLQNQQATSFNFAAGAFLFTGLILFWFFPVNILFFAVAMILAVVGQNKKNA